MARPIAQQSAQARTFHHSRYPPDRVAAALGAAGLTVSVCLPARECAATVDRIVSMLGELRAQGLVDQVVVVDAASEDGTATVAQRAGASVCQEDELLPDFGPVRGKGDAMWRALSVLDGELICFLDADTEDFGARFVTGLLGALACESDVDFVKACYRRPFVAGGASLPEGGGRVNHLMARPALALFYPQLAGIGQPLAGEVAARRELLVRLPFSTGYGVEIGMLIDVWRELGLARIAQVDLGERRNRHQPLTALTPMALQVLATVACHLREEGRLQDGGADPPVDGLLRRPPLLSVQAA
jgi:glucosyl-3-phosphoglycerate synthase